MRSLSARRTTQRRPEIGAIALRVRDADVAYRHAIDMGAWPIQTRAGVMELNIPGVHGAGDSILYFVDRVGDFGERVPAAWTQ
ncbi:MAG: 4-hydroxyphenylpyruvate dioxygenase [Massilia sp.]|jgi:4-hydroxyphenylpyruvate dioxygenase